MKKFLLLVFSLICSLASGQPQLPAGFTQTLMAQHLDPTDMVLTSDNRIFITIKNGKVLVIENEVLLANPLLNIESIVDNVNERGVGHIVLDPQFDTNGFFYLYYNVKGGNHNRVSRFTAVNNASDPSSEVVLMDLNVLTSDVHNGGDMVFGTDGKLYISSGDGAFGDNAQSLTSLLGKVLRVNSDGTIPTDNPFYTVNGGIYNSIWAIGLRNPFSMDIQPGTGKIFVSDVGNYLWEEINEVQAGKNCGWPRIEGVRTTQTPQPNYKDPLYAYAHGSGPDQGCAIVGAAFYNPVHNQFPVAYTSKFFFGDYCNGYIKYIDPVSGVVNEFITGIYRPLAVLISPDGSLYYLARAGIGGGSVDDNTTSTAGTLWKVTYPGDGIPHVSVSPQPVTVAQAHPATFTVYATGSEPLSYQWQVDETSIVGATAATYTIPNVLLSDNGKKFRCIVSNAVGKDTSDYALLTVTISTPPSASFTITLPQGETKYKGGDVISFSGTATDVEDGVLPASAFTWKIDFHHDTHYHPGLVSTSGIASGTYTIPKIGETSDNVWYKVYLTVRDADGLSTTITQDVFPLKVDITLRTTPPGLNLLLDGQPVLTPFTFKSVVNITRSLEAPDGLVISNNKFYSFDHWSETELQRSFFFDAPGAAKTYQANFVEVPGCVYPTALTVTDIYKNKATLHWVGNNTSTFNVQYKTTTDANWTTLTANTNSITLTDLTCTTNYVFQVQSVCDATHSSDYSASSTFSTLDCNNNCTPLPTGWLTQDIGTVGLPGAACYDNGVFQLKGSGDDVWNTQDAFRLAYKTFTGDGDIQARILTMDYTHPWNKCGLMIRESLASGSRNIFIALTSEHGILFQGRVATNEISSEIAAVTGITAPTWFKLTKRGTLYTAYRSTNGITWIQVGTPIDAGFGGTTPVYAGLALSAHNNSDVSTATIDNFHFTGVPEITLQNFSAALTSGKTVSVEWSTTRENNISNFVVERSINAIDYNDLVTVQAVNAGNVTKNYYYEDGTPFENISYYRLRITDDSGGKTYSTPVTISNIPAPVCADPVGLSVTDIFTDHVTLHWTGSNAASFVVQYKNAGDVNWTTVPSSSNVVNILNLDCSTNYLFKVQAICDATHSSNYSSSFSFSTLVCDNTTSCNPLPAGWSSQDIGAVSRAGSACYNNNIIELKASGEDIWITQDAFRFAYQSYAGDGDIHARVLTMDFTHPWNKCGIMIRESLTPGSRNVFIALTSENGILFQNRIATNSTTGETGSITGIAAPTWFKLSKRGTLYTAYRSADGIAWTKVGESVDAGFGGGTTPVYAGLALSAHNNSDISTATVDSYRFETIPPVTVQNFTATLTQERTVSLEWAITEGDRIENFIIERSSDNLIYSDLETLMINNGGRIANAYNYEDKSPLSNQSYYRVAVTHDGGAKSYSVPAPVSIVTATSSALEESHPVVYSNPTKNGIVHVKHTPEEIKLITLYDYNGKALVKLNKIHSDVTDIPVTSFANGLYLIEIKTSKGTYREKLIIHN